MFMVFLFMLNDINPIHYLYKYYVNEYYIQSDLTGFLKSINIECVRCKFSLIDVDYSKQNKNHFSSLIGENIHGFLAI